MTPGARTKVIRFVQAVQIGSLLLFNVSICLFQQLLDDPFDLT